MQTSLNSIILRWHAAAAKLFVQIALGHNLCVPVGMQLGVGGGTKAGVNCWRALRDVRVDHKARPYFLLRNANYEVRMHLDELSHALCL